MSRPPPRPTTAIVPMLLPRLSDRAAAQLVDILEQFLVVMRHHYAPQLASQRRRQTVDPPQHRPAANTGSGEPF